MSLKVGGLDDVRAVEVELLPWPEPLAVMVESDIACG